MNILNNNYVDNIIRNALAEDIPYGDVTTDSLIDPASSSAGTIELKEDGIIAGLDVAGRVFEMLDNCVVLEKLHDDGSYLKKGTVIGQIEGSTHALLKGERTALNLLQRLSGIATSAWKLCELVNDLPVKVVDTRKTTPGLRLLEKYAVLMGGGRNHRFSLSDGILIKDNHILAAGSITEAVKRARKNATHMVKIEVETEDLSQVMEALEAGADIIMLDNMDTVAMKEAVEFIGKRVLTEASGNITVDTIRDIALTGVDMISVGALTHSVKALDISLSFK